MKVITAHTLEIDDVELAVSEVLEQLDLPNNLLKHTAGVLTCYAEFIDSGVVKALSDALPFDVVGATTIGNADGSESSHLMLSLLVLTADDCSFSAVYTDSLAGEQQSPLRAAYQKAKENLPGEPAMMLSFLPLIYAISGDQTIRDLDAITGGLPNFGTVAVDHNPDYSQAYTTLNGEFSKDRMAMLLISGNVHPRFLIASISESKIIKQRAIITKSQGSLLMEVNNMPALKYLETLGLSQNGQIEGGNSVPFMVDFGDGHLLARAIFAVTPEGYAVCGGVMPEGAALAVGNIDFEDVMHTTRGTMVKALQDRAVSGMLMFSCISRYLALGMDTLAEMGLVRQSLPEGMPYQFTYSGGEVCPVYAHGGEPVCRFHNDSFVVCVF